MESINKAIIVGHLGRDPEIRQGQVTSFSVATSERWKDASGAQQEHTEWHNVTAFGKLADIAAQYLKKGTLVYVEGRLRTRKYTDREGVERYQTGIIADRVQMLGSRGDGGSGGASRQSGQNEYERQHGRPARTTPTNNTYDDDDIPF